MQRAVKYRGDVSFRNPYEFTVTEGQPNYVFSVVSLNNLLRKIVKMSVIGDAKLLTKQLKFHPGYIFLRKVSWKKLTAWVNNEIDIKLWDMIAERRDNFTYIALGNVSPAWMWQL